MLKGLPLPSCWHLNAIVFLPDSYFFFLMSVCALPWHLFQCNAWTCTLKYGLVLLATQGFSSSLEVMVNAFKYQAKSCPRYRWQCLFKRSKAVRPPVFSQFHMVTEEVVWQRWPLNLSADQACISSTSLFPFFLLHTTVTAPCVQKARGGLWRSGRILLADGDVGGVITASALLLQEFLPPPPPRPRRSQVSFGRNWVWCRTNNNKRSGRGSVAAPCCNGNPQALPELTVR